MTQEYYLTTKWRKDKRIFLVVRNCVKTYAKYVRQYKIFDNQCTFFCF